MEDIKLVRLVTGEELVGMVTIIGDEVIIGKAVRIVPTKEAPMILPISMFLNEKTPNIAILRANVLWVVDLNDNLKMQYNKEFGNGLLLPPENKGIIIAQ